MEKMKDEILNPKKKGGGKKGGKKKWRKNEDKMIDRFIFTMSFQYFFIFVMLKLKIYK
jgi:hypothetical protein